jgi:hypothetical protein
MKTNLKKWGWAAFLGLWACAANDQGGDLPATHFSAWIQGTKKYFSTYLVVRLKDCSACTQTTVKLIRDGYLNLAKETAIVLVVDGQSELYPVRDALHLPNLLVYSSQEWQQPILGDAIRLYRYSKKRGFSFKELTAKDFATLTSRMLNQDLAPFKDSTSPNGSTMDVIRGMAIPGQEALIVLSDSGRLEVSPAL